MRVFTARSLLYYATAAIVLSTASVVASANTGQFVAKQYTEALGRAPDVAGWNYSMNSLNQWGCNKSNLLSISKGLFTSAEYDNLGYDNYEKVLTVYRAVLNREPDAGGFSYWVNYLNSGYSMTAFIDAIGAGIDNGEVTVSEMCRSLGYGWNNPTQPLTNATIPAKSDGGITTLAQLQTALASALPGSTVYLSQRAVIMTSQQIRVRPGVTLATVGLPPPNQYAKQARIVRTATFGGPGEDSMALVALESGAKLDSVWIGGQAQQFTYALNAVNVALISGTGTTLAQSRLDNANGWAAVVGHNFGTPCNAMIVVGNLLTGYSNSHHYHDPLVGYTDGISANCKDITISYNSVIDASDIGIILFSTAEQDASQNGKIHNNTVISAGVPAFGALMLASNTAGGYTGAEITDNLLWASPDTHFDLGIIVGGATWVRNAQLSTGGSITGNNTGNIFTPMNIGLLVDGMTDVHVQRNYLSRAEPYVGYPDRPDIVYNFRCNIKGDRLADTPGHASFSVSSDSFIYARVHDCIGHSAP